MPAPVFRKGLNLKHAVAGALAEDYHSQLVNDIKSSGFKWVDGRLTIHLAQEFGICYGVDRAVDYAYQTRARFPNNRVYLTGEIIHNPQVNTRLRNAGIVFLSDPGQSIEQLQTDDVVILPAFGVTVRELELLDRQGCTLIDTTCGSVLNVWKNVRRYTEDGFTAVIHGKVHHEETQATASQALTARHGRYLIVLNRDEAAIVCNFILGQIDTDTFFKHFRPACSEGFEPHNDLSRVGLANQTTMLMSESLEIGEMFRAAMIERYGPDVLDDHYRAFETICSATEDRQDAIQTLLNENEFTMAVVIGGYNSSNTRNLARICGKTVPTYHIADASCLVSENEIRHRPTDSHFASTVAGIELNSQETISNSWFPPEGPVSIALTAGASTPDSIVGSVIQRLADFSQNTT